MKQLEVFNKIGGIIKELNDQYKYIEANPADLNELELELFVANAHFLADHADILIKLNLKSKAEKHVEQTNIAEQKETPPAEKYFEPVVRQLKPEVRSSNTLSETDDEPAASIDLSSNTPEDSYSYLRKEPEIIRHELVIDEAEIDKDIATEDEEKILAEQESAEDTVADEEQVAPVLDEVKPVAKELETKDDVAAEPEAKDEVKPVAAEPEAKDKVKPIAAEPEAKDEVLTINQKISAQLGNKGGITEQVHGQPVANLKQAITLNDKLLFVKELFNGYSLAYSEAIEILNRFNTFEEAERFLNKNYIEKNDWASKPDTTEKFYAILRRRYL